MRIKLNTKLRWTVYNDTRCLGEIRAFTRRSAVIEAKRRFGAAVWVEKVP